MYQGVSSSSRSPQRTLLALSFKELKVFLPDKRDVAEVVIQEDDRVTSLEVKSHLEHSVFCV